MRAYCLKCRAMRDIRDVKLVLSKDGRPAAEGQCMVCGKKVFRLNPPDSEKS